ncbi:sugar phosphate isomerase/epimerase family protein [Stieleria sedimenti]|uniref:sugar phosphate isomerase/epimerase family protein n=1 Tax=Stieleria sedimenti TaxID=2976331 RepID=UPI003899C4B8
MLRYAIQLSCLFFAASFVFAETDESESFQPSFYAFENGVKFGSYQSEAETLKQLGYDGISQVHSGGIQLAGRIAAYDKVGLRVLSIYLNVNDTPIAAEVVKPLANREALIELTVQKMTSKTVQAVRRTVEMAADLNIRVALYPHHGFAIAKMPQAMELIKRVNHPNLGVMFNLCHFLKGEEAEDLETVLENAGSRLFAISTSGANLGGQDWGELIQRLDQGDFPQGRLFRHLKKLGYEGPVALQCFGIHGDKRTNLERSVAAWRRIIAAL